MQTTDNTVLTKSPVRPAAGQPAAAATALPSISVILPNYNHGRWLRRSLAALVAQAGPSKEIVVIDDGSTDNSAEVIDDFCRRYDCIRVIRHDINRGIFAALQAGIEAARGEFLLFAAADDFVLPGLLARADAALRAYPEAAFFCASVVLIDREGRMIGFRPIVPPRFSTGYMSPAEVRQQIKRTDNWFIGQSVVYRRRPLADIGYFDTSLGSLCDGLAQRLLAFRHGFYFDTETLAVWLVDPTSLSAQTTFSVSESRRVLDSGIRWIAERFPVDIRESYGAVFERRMRFNLARQYLVQRHQRPDSNAICGLLGWGSVAASTIDFLCRLPVIGRTLVLAAVTLHLRPISLAPLLKSWWRMHITERGKWAALHHTLPGTVKI